MTNPIRVLKFSIPVVVSFSYWMATAQNGVWDPQTLLGTYHLEMQETGNCFEEIEVTPWQSESQEVPSRGLSIWGYPQGFGNTVAQIQDVDQGMQFDEFSNPMTIFKSTSYAPRIGYTNADSIVFFRNQQTYSTRRSARLSVGTFSVVTKVSNRELIRIKKGFFDLSKKIFDVEFSCLYKSKK